MCKSEPAVKGAADGALGVGGDEGVDRAAARGEVVVHAGLVWVAAEGACKRDQEIVVVIK